MPPIVSDDLSQVPRVAVPRQSASAAAPGPWNTMSSRESASTSPTATRYAPLTAIGRFVKLDGPPYHRVSSVDPGPYHAMSS